MNIKCLNKKEGFFPLQICWQIKLHQKCSAFLANKKIGVEGFSEKPSTPFFFICLYLIGAGGDENLKHYLAWPYFNKF